MNARINAAFPILSSPSIPKIMASPTIAKLLLKLPWMNDPWSSGDLVRKADTPQLIKNKMNTSTNDATISFASKACPISMLESLTNTNAGSETLNTKLEVCLINASLTKLVLCNPEPINISRKIGAIISIVKSKIDIIFLISEKLNQSWNCHSENLWIILGINPIFINNCWHQCYLTFFKS